MTISKAAQNYLKDVFQRKPVKDIDPMTMHCIIENVEMDNSVIDKEIMEAYFKENALKPMNAQQFYARKC